MNQVSMTLIPAGLLHFYPWLQEGVRLEVELGGSIKDALCRQLEIPPDFLENRIQTVFLDGRPVDDFDKTVLRGGATMALSAAMPGLLGAVMRRGGSLACFRSSISYRPEEADSGVELGIIRLRLFNLLLKELGPVILKKGILLEVSELLSLLESPAGTIERDLKDIRINERQVTYEELTSMLKRTGPDRVLLSIEFPL